MLSAPARSLLLTVVLVSSLVTGCGPDAEPTEGRSSSATSSTASTTAPAPAVPTTYPDAALVAALPSTDEQRHGVPETDSCLTLDQPCQPGEDAGAAFVTGGKDRSSPQLLVSVIRQYRAEDWSTQLENCPEGRYEKPLQTLSETSYVPGERGTARRTKLTSGTWSGFVCTKDIVRLFPEEVSERATEFGAALNNGRHILVLRGRTFDETIDLATEYLQRLEGSTD